MARMNIRPQKKNLIGNNYPPRVSPEYEVITMLDYDLARVRTIQSIEAPRVRRPCREFPLSESQSALDAPTKTIWSLYSLEALLTPPSTRVRDFVSDKFIPRP